MLDHLNANTTITNTSQVNVQSQSHQQQHSSTSQIALDFDSILQELKSVGEAHQPSQGQTTMIVENIKQEELHMDSNNTGKRRENERTDDENRKEGSRVINLSSFGFLIETIQINKSKLMRSNDRKIVRVVEKKKRTVKYFPSTLFVRIVFSFQCLAMIFLHFSRRRIRLQHYLVSIR